MLDSSTQRHPRKAAGHRESLRLYIYFNSKPLPFVSGGSETPANIPAAHLHPQDVGPRSGSYAASASRGAAEPPLRCQPEKLWEAASSPGTIYPAKYKNHRPLLKSGYKIISFVVPRTPCPSLHRSIHQHSFLLNGQKQLGHKHYQAET